MEGMLVKLLGQLADRGGGAERRGEGFIGGG